MQTCISCLDSVDMLSVSQSVLLLIHFLMCFPSFGVLVMGNFRFGKMMRIHFRNSSCEVNGFVNNDISQRLVNQLILETKGKDINSYVLRKHKMNKNMDFSILNQFIFNLIDSILGLHNYSTFGVSEISKQFFIYKLEYHLVVIRKSFTVMRLLKKIEKSRIAGEYVASMRFLCCWRNKISSQVYQERRKAKKKGRCSSSKRKIRGLKENRRFHCLMPLMVGLCYTCDLNVFGYFVANRVFNGWIMNFFTPNYLLSYGIAGKGGGNPCESKLLNIKKFEMGSGVWSSTNDILHCEILKLKIKVESNITYATLSEGCNGSKLVKVEELEVVNGNGRKLMGETDNHVTVAVRSSKKIDQMKVTFSIAAAGEASTKNQQSESAYLVGFFSFWATLSEVDCF